MKIPPGLSAGRKEALFPPLPGREQGTMPFSPSALGNITFCAQPSIPAFPFHPILLQFIQGEVDTEQIHDEYIKTRDQQKAHLYPHTDDDHCTVGVSCQHPVTGGDHQRNAARNGNQGSHQNGPQAQKGDRRRDFHQAFVALHFQIGKFHDQDGILAAHPASIPRPNCA